MRIEMQDGIPVTQHATIFKRTTMAVDSEYGEKLQGGQNGHTGTVSVWLLSSVTGDDVTYKRREDGTEYERVTDQTLDTVIPLTGAMRDQAIVFLSYDGEKGVVDFVGEVTEYEEEMDRLAQYLKKSWPDAVERFTPARIVNACMDLLEAYKDGIPPALATAVEESPVPNQTMLEPSGLGERVIPFEGGVFAGETTEPDPRYPTPVDVGGMSFELESFDVSDELKELMEMEEKKTDETDEADEADEAEAPKTGAVDAAELKAMMAEGEGSTAESREHFQTAKIPEDVAAIDDEVGEAVNVFADDHETLGSVYGPNYQGKNRDMIEGAFAP